MKGTLLALLVALLVGATAQAHEVRPAYLELTETQPATYEMLWKVPALGSATLRLQPRLADACSMVADAPPVVLEGAVIERSVITCPGGLASRSLSIDGLEATVTDVLVRIRTLDGTVHTTRLTPDSPSMVVSPVPDGLEVAWTYLTLGVDHILAGFDHLLFVLALLLLVHGWRRLALTITAFTLAHSLTLALATFGLVRVAPGIVEAMIALSIVLVAVEVVRSREGEGGLAARWPWLIAFAFGLLHGLGFAGALAEIGLPDNAIVEALLFFNVGVEIGQLLVVAIVLLTIRLVRAVGIGWPGWSWRVAAYAIGSISAFWTIERLSVLA